MDVILEDGLSFVKVDAHEAILVIVSTLEVEALPRLVLN